MLIKIDQLKSRQVNNAVKRNLTKTEISTLQKSANNLVSFLVEKGKIIKDVEVKGGVTTGGTPYFMLKSSNRLFGAYRAITKDRSKKMKTAFVPEVQNAMWANAVNL